MENQAEVLRAIGSDLDRPIVTYCTDAECTGSGIAALLLQEAGYRNVRQFLPLAAVHLVRALISQYKGREFLNGPYKNLIDRTKLWSLVAVIIAVFALNLRC